MSNVGMNIAKEAIQQKERKRNKTMFYHVQNLINPIVDDEPDPSAANALQEGLGGQFGEMRTMMQYLFQAFNFRGAAGKPYKDLLYGVGTEEIAHVELIATTTWWAPRVRCRSTPSGTPGRAPTSTTAATSSSTCSTTSCSSRPAVCRS